MRGDQRFEKIVKDVDGGRIVGPGKCRLSCRVKGPFKVGDRSFFSSTIGLSSAGMEKTHLGMVRTVASTCSVHISTPYCAFSY